MLRYDIAVTAGPVVSGPNADIGGLGRVGKHGESDHRERPGKYFSMTTLPLTSLGSTRIRPDSIPEAVRLGKAVSEVICCRSTFARLRAVWDRRPVGDSASESVIEAGTRALPRLSLEERGLRCGLYDNDRSGATS